MRIAIVSDCFAPRVGGIESQVGDLAAHQARAGHEVHVLTATAGERHRGLEITAEGVRVHRMASHLTFGLPVNPWGGHLQRRALAALRPDVVHVQAGMISPFAFQGALAARALGLPLAITWHCMLDGVRPLMRLGGRWLEWHGETAALSAVSSVAAQRVAQCFPVEGRAGAVGVLPNGLELADWRPTTPVRRWDGVLRLVATQRVAPRKRTRALVDIVARAAREVPVHLTLAGDGPDLAAVRRLVARRGVAEHVDLLGRVPRTDLPALYARHDAFLSATQLEAFGIAALEGRSAGLPVIAMRTSGISTFVTDGREGLLADDDAGLADALVRLARDTELRERLTAHVRAVPPPMGWPDVLAAAEREYARARRLLPFRP